MFFLFFAPSRAHRADPKIKKNKNYPSSLISKTYNSVVEHASYEADFSSWQGKLSRTLSGGPPRKVLQVRFGGKNTGEEKHSKIDQP